MTQSLERLIESRPIGSRWKKSKAAALNTPVSTPSRAPPMIEASSTAGRYTTASDTTGAIRASGYTITVHSATSTPAVSTPAVRDGGFLAIRNPNELDMTLSTA